MAGTKPLLPQADKDDIAKHLEYGALVVGLEKAFQEARIETPQRHHHNYVTGAKEQSTLLLMPSWEQEEQIGVKLVTISPGNTRFGLPSIHGLYVLFDTEKGFPLMLMDGQELTARRTAAASALASSYLSLKEASRLVLLGTGAMAPHLIRAHCAVRQIRYVSIWGRDRQKAQNLASRMSAELPNAEIVATEDIHQAVSDAHIISCATLAAEPIIFGKWLRNGQHVDLVGSYKPEMREADDEVMRRSSLFVDTPTALKESGDLVIPLSNSVINEQDVRGTLFTLANHTTPGRTSEEEITCFKSVGHALEDLVAARLVFTKMSTQ